MNKFCTYFHWWWGILSPASYIAVLALGIGTSLLPNGFWLLLVAIAVCCVRVLFLELHGTKRWVAYHCEFIIRETLFSGRPLTEVLKDERKDLGSNIVALAISCALYMVELAGFWRVPLLVAGMVTVAAFAVMTAIIEVKYRLIKRDNDRYLDVVLPVTEHDYPYLNQPAAAMIRGKVITVADLRKVLTEATTPRSRWTYPRMKGCL